MRDALRCSMAVMAEATGRSRSRLPSMSMKKMYRPSPVLVGRLSSLAEVDRAHGELLEDRQQRARAVVVEARR